MFQKAFLTYRSFGLPPWVIAQRVFNKLLAKFHQRKIEKQLYRGNYISVPPSVSLKKGLVGKIDTTYLSSNHKVSKVLFSYFQLHKFNLLGSGWKDQLYVKPLPIEQHIESELPNHFKTRAKELLSKCSESYTLIDWQKCFSSDYRFKASVPFTSITIPKGADIKEPWELSRLQHLPQMLSLTFCSPEQQDWVATEVKDQLLDFFAFNPVGFGVNWVSPMDVAIRLISIVLSWELLHQLNRKKELSVLAKPLATHVYECAKFISKNLENKQGRTGNHYLFNLIGLLVAGQYLIDISEAKKWKKFASQELSNEFGKQFYDDGLNAEASTAYHYLTSEAILLGFYYLDQKHQEEFKRIHQLKLINWYQSLGSLLKPNQNIPQIGDNDSGCLLNLTPTGKIVSKEEFLQDRIVPKTVHTTEGFVFEAQTLKKENLLRWRDALSGKGNGSIAEEQLFASSCLASVANEGSNLQNPHPKPFKPLTYQKQKTFSYAQFTDQPISTQGNWKVFKDFGLAVFKTENLYLLLSFSTENKKNHGWRHQHNDKLGLELYVGEKDVLVDPGTYVYTPSPEWRNRFRSAKVHNIPLVEGEEQNRFLPTSSGIFNMVREAKANLLLVEKTRIMVEVKYRSIHLAREVSVLPDEIVIKDQGNKPFHQLFNPFDYYSPGYGELVKNPFPKV